MFILIKLTQYLVNESITISVKLTVFHQMTVFHQIHQQSYYEITFEANFKFGPNSHFSVFHNLFLWTQYLFKKLIFI
jgi:hypothetical protein